MIVPFKRFQTCSLKAEAGDNQITMEGEVDRHSIGFYAIDRTGEFQEVNFNFIKYAQNDDRPEIPVNKGAVDTLHLRDLCPNLLLSSVQTTELRSVQDHASELQETAAADQAAHLYKRIEAIYI